MRPHLALAPFQDALAGIGQHSDVRLPDGALAQPGLHQEEGEHAPGGQVRSLQER